MTELEAILILNSISGLGNIRIRRLLEVFGSAIKILSLTQSELAASGIIPSTVARNIVSFKHDEFLQNELRLMKESGVLALTFQNSDYPENLAQIPDSPVVLYVKGKLINEDNLAVAIVGSRRSSDYGLTVAEKFSSQLAQLEITIVSGMARGIDTCAHRGALQAKGRTIAVLGSGLSVIYPRENEKLFEEIADAGAVVSEFPMTTAPVPFNFPRRNRVISGLSLGVIVVEAAKNSGALITSRFALEQGREVFAVPGHVDSPNSQGAHELIKQGAKLVQTIEDVLEELKIPIETNLEIAKQANVAARRNMSPVVQLPGDEKTIYECIQDEALHIDEIAGQSGCPASQAMGVLLKLELKHLVKQLPGKRFVRAGHAF